MKPEKADSKKRYGRTVYQVRCDVSEIPKIENRRFYLTFCTGDGSKKIGILILSIRSSHFSCHHHARQHRSPQSASVTRNHKHNH
eukprot:scaffold96532_cov43-Attheya_sp.AAC.1